MRENLKTARKEKEMTQEQVAEYLNISLRTYKYIEAGRIIGKVGMWDAYTESEVTR